MQTGKSDPLACKGLTSANIAANLPVRQFWMKLSEVNSLGLPTVNPFDHRNYSMWPLAVTCYNLPGHLRMTLPVLGLLFIIPPHGSQKGEPDDFQPFLTSLLTSCAMPIGMALRE